MHIPLANLETFEGEFEDVMVKDGSITSLSLVNSCPDTNFTPL